MANPSSECDRRRGVCVLEFGGRRSFEWIEWEDEQSERQQHARLLLDIRLGRKPFGYLGFKLALKEGAKKSFSYSVVPSHSVVSWEESGNSFPLGQGSWIWSGRPGAPRASTRSRASPRKCPSTTTSLRGVSSSCKVRCVPDVGMLCLRALLR